MLVVYAKYKRKELIMGKNLYEQKFNVVLTSELHMTDEYLDETGQGTLFTSYGNPIDTYDIKRALDDPLKAVLLDVKEVLCAQSLCDADQFYHLDKCLPNHSDGSITMSEYGVYSDAIFAEGRYQLLVKFFIGTVFDKQLTERDVMDFLPQVVVKYGNVVISEMGSVSVVDATKMLDKTKVSASVNYRMYHDGKRKEFYELPDRLNVSVCVYSGRSVVRFVEYYRDLYEYCVNKVKADKYFCMTSNPPLTDLMSYGYEYFEYGYNDDDIDYGYRDRVTSVDSLAVSNFLNNFLNAYYNYEATEDTKDLLDADDHFRDDIIWTEELLDKVMVQFGFTRR